jgi:hypothetical protein
MPVQRYHRYQDLQEQEGPRAGTNYLLGQLQAIRSPRSSVLKMQSRALCCGHEAATVATGRYKLQRELKSQLEFLECQLPRDHVRKH